MLAGGWFVLREKVLLAGSRLPSEQGREATKGLA
jgi:hypothetical protein